MTRAQREALDLLRRARAQCPSTDDGVVTNEATFYDSEIDVAYVHRRTARALHDLGHITFGAYDPDWGTEIRLAPGQEAAAT